MFDKFVSWKTMPALKRYRVAKFKQRRQIKSRSHLATLQHVQIGGCTGLSFEWVRRHRLRTGERPGARIDFLNTDAAWSSINIFAHFFNSAPGLGNHADRIARVAPNGCGLRRGAHIDEQDYQAFAATLQHFDACPGYQIVEMRFNQLVPNHICALYAGRDGLRFFDPNSGEYSVPVSDAARFLRALSAQYATYVSPTGEAKALTFRNLYFYHVG